MCLRFVMMLKVMLNKLMRKIPKDILEEYLKDPFSKECCFCGSPHPQLHHNLLYGGRQVNEAWTFLPLCKTCHDKINNVKLRRLGDWAMFNRATKEDLTRYSRVMDYTARLKFLNGFFGQFSPRKMRDLYTSGKYEKAQ